MHGILPSKCISFTVASPQPTDNVPLRPPRRKKGEKRNNIYTGPPDEAAPGDRIRLGPATEDTPNVTFHPGTLCLPILPDGPDVNLDDRGFPDRQRDYDFLVEESDGVDLIRKIGPELPTTVDPEFDVKFDEPTHGAYLQKHLATGHMPASRASRTIEMVKRHWRVFNPDGVRFPVIGYECDIDTGDASPVTCGNVNYGPRESKIMEKHIAALVEVNHVYEISTSRWMSKALLAPKPHQESVYDIMFFK